MVIAASKSKAVEERVFEPARYVRERRGSKRRFALPVIERNEPRVAARGDAEL